MLTAIGHLTVNLAKECVRLMNESVTEYQNADKKNDACVL